MRRLRVMMGAAGVVLGILLAVGVTPVLSDQAVADGQLLRRSDGTTYVVWNGVRHAVSPAALDDAAIDAIPEGQAWTTGLRPIGSGVVLGQARQAGHEVITLRKVTRPFVSSNQFSTPSPGNEFLLVEVAVQNTGGETAELNPLQFSVQREDATIAQLAVGVVRPDELPLINLLPGQTVDGTLAYEMPKGTAATSLIFQPSGGADPVIIPLS